MPRLDAMIPALVLLATTAAGCASGGGTSAYAADLKTLEQECTARGGILTPISSTSGRPQTDYACRIRNGTLLRD